MEIDRKLVDLDRFLPKALRGAAVTDTLIPRIARDAALTNEIESALQSIPSTHHLRQGDAREMPFLRPNSVHLVLTSPPYWTLKRYKESAGQMGHIDDYDEFLDALDAVWRQCFKALVPGGRLICVVGDVCLSRRKNNGRHTVVPLHASIQERCRAIGFDNLSPIIWHKISNAAYEVEGGGGFLGKPYEPNAVIKNDIEFILMQRKHGGYRSPTPTTRVLSIIPEERQRQWFQQIWSGITGASTREHPAPYPVELAERLVRMFSFVGDVILDPFMGTATTTVAAHRAGRNSIGVELNPDYFEAACRRAYAETRDLFDTAKLRVFPLAEEGGAAEPQARGSQGDRVHAEPNAVRPMTAP
jgi:DNA modification methylase